MSQKVLTLEQGLEVVKHLENGKSSKEIAQIMAIKMGRMSLLNKVMDMDKLVIFYFTPRTVWETTARQLAKCECKMILASISVQVLAILVSWHVMPSS
jgi:hypothetical protein